MRAYLIVRPLELPNSISPNPPIPKALCGSEQLQSVVHLDFVPHRQERLDGLFRLSRIRPHDRLEELGQGAFVPREVEAELPHEIALRSRQLLRRRVPQDLLQRPRNGEESSALVTAIRAPRGKEQTLSSSRILAFGFSSRSSGPFR